MHDLRFATRFFARGHTFTIFVVAFMAVTAALASVVFSVYDQVVVRPLPFEEPGRLVLLEREHVLVEHAKGVRLAPRDVYELPQFDSFGIYDTGWVTVLAGENLVRLRAAAATGGVFQVLRARPLLGRTLEPQDDAAVPVAVLGYDVWTRYFNSDAGAVGRTIHINDRPFLVVGVMPQQFSYPGVSLWLPPQADPQMTAPMFRPTVMARLSHGVSREAAAEALARLRRQFFGNPAGRPARPIAPLERPLAATYGRVARALTVLTGLLLVAACTNVAGLLISLTWTRQLEFSTRIALGASPGRLLRQITVEAGLLASAGAALGVALGYAGWRRFVASLPVSSIEAAFLVFDARALAVGLAVVFLCAALVCAVVSVPAFRQRSVSSEPTFAAQSRIRGGWLITLSSGAAVCLMSIVSAMYVSLAAEAERSLGFSNDRAIAIEVSLPRSRYRDSETVLAFAGEVTSRFSQDLGRIALTDVPPASDVRPAGIVLKLGTDPAASSRVEDGPGGRLRVVLADGPVASVVAVTPTYFDIMGVPVLAGRAFTDDDGPGSAEVVVLSEGAARRITSNITSLIGQTLSNGAGGQWDIVGIVGDASLIPHPLAPGRKELQVYRPFRQLVPRDRLGILIDPGPNPDSAVAALRHDLLQMDPTVPMFNVRNMGRLVADTFARERFITGFAGLVALLVLGLSAVGVYGTLSQFVGQRMREFGIKVALGATPRTLWRPILRWTLIFVLVGSSCGAMAGIAVWRWLATFTVGAQRPSASMLLWCAAIVAIVAVFAASGPARRASRADPAELLRAS